MNFRKTISLVVLFCLLVAGMSTPAAASFNPPFTEVTGTDNPFDGVDVGDYSAPSFADLDGDGDLDAFIGAGDGWIYYYRNEGTAANPAFTNVTGSGNPFNGVGVGSNSTPSFADLDGDGDLDAFIGAYNGWIYYYRSNRPPQAENPTVTVNEDALDTAVDLWPAFQDPDHTPDSSLTYTVTANTDPALFSEVTLTGGQYLNLDYAPEANGAAALTVQATDPGGLWVTTTLQVTVNPVNDAPSFVKGQDRYVLEDCGPMNYPAWVTAFSPGPANESSQSPLAYHLESDNPTLFAAAPAIDPASGDLSFTPAADAWGTATVTATVQDDGGTALGGVDTSAPQTFLITVYQVDEFLNVEAGSDQSGEEGETLTFSGTCSDPDDPQRVLEPDIVLWDFGDGYSASGSLTAQHAYGDSGTYTATLIVVDYEDGAGWDTLQVTITVAVREYRVYLPLVTRK